MEFFFRVRWMKKIKHNSVTPTNTSRKPPGFDMKSQRGRSQSQKKKEFEMTYIRTYHPRIADTRI